MINTQALKEFFDVGSFGPLFLFVLGVYSTSLFATKNYSLGVFVIMIAFIVYIASNIFLRSHKQYDTYFNDYLDDMAIFLTFAVSTIIFGLVYFGSNPLFLGMIFFYAIASILSIARNSILNLKNTSGYPIALNGIFFPLTYYFYLFYLDAMGSSIFLLYYIVIGFLLISDYNFLGSVNSKKEIEESVDKHKEFIEASKKEFEHRSHDFDVEFKKDKKKLSRYLDKIKSKFSKKKN